MRRAGTKIPVWLARRRFSPLIRQLIADRIAARPSLEPAAPVPVADNVIMLNLIWSKDGRWALAPCGMRPLRAGRA